MNMPSLITGPAIVIWNGRSYYFKGDLGNPVKRETFKAEVNGAEIDERLKSQMAEVSGTPASQLDDMTKYWPYGVAKIGQPLFDSTNKLPLVIIPFSGEQITYPNAALTRTPDITLKAGADALFGEMTWTCLGDPAKGPADPAYFRTMAASAFADASFDESRNISDLYTAAWGGAPYDTMLSIDGFVLSNPLKLWNAGVDSFGVVNIILQSMTVAAKFKPANLTETQIDGLMNLQGPNAIPIGGSLAAAGRDLVITGGTLNATLKNVGPKDSLLHYSTARLRQGEIAFVQRRTWTAGAANELFTLTCS